MKETKLLGTLLPSHPELKPIIQELRDKYQLPEISLDDEPIQDIYLGDDFVSLKDFYQELLDLVREKSNIFDGQPQFEKFYKTGKQLLGRPLILKGYEKLLPNKTKKAIYNFYDVSHKMFEPIVKLVDEQYKVIADIIYTYLLTGEAGEVPEDWFSKVTTVKIGNDPYVFVMASQLVDPDIVINQFRHEYKKNFGIHRPKITNTVVTTAYYLRLKKMGKPMSYIVGEYVRINKISLPRDRTSPRYFEILRKCEQTLKKRMQRSQKVLEVIGRDI